MSDVIGLELQFFLDSILWGIILLVIYDVIRIFRRIIPHNWVMQALGDILFWMVGSLLIFRMMYIRNNGIIRGFSILGMLLGMIVYNRTVSPYIVKYLAHYINVVIRWLLRPLRWLWNRLRWSMDFAKKKNDKICKKKRKALKKVKKTFRIYIKKK